MKNSICLFLTFCWFILTADVCSESDNSVNVDFENLSDKTIYILYYADLNEEPNTTKAFENEAYAKIVPAGQKAYILHLWEDDVNGDLKGKSRFNRMYFHVFAIEAQKFQIYDTSTIIKEQLVDSIYTISFADGLSYLQYR